MKRTFLLLLCGPVLLSCGPDPNTKKPEQNLAKETVSPQENSAQEFSAAEKGTVLRDSTTGANVSAVAHQPQVDTNTTKIGTAPVGNPVEAGAKLIASSDCASCHRVDQKLLGPSYQDIARKYPATAANEVMLAKKIISGGQGNWGAVAMTPHPGLSEKDARGMAHYILGLK